MDATLPLRTEWARPREAVPSNSELPLAWSWARFANKLLPKNDLADPPGDARFAQIIGRHLHLHPVAHGQAHPSLAHLAANGRQHLVLVFQINSKHCAGEDNRHDAFNFNMLFFCLNHSVFRKTSAQRMTLCPCRPQGAAGRKSEAGLLRTPVL